ncbi:MAG: c-type cytochrome [Rhodospirillales bacterium]
MQHAHMGLVVVADPAAQFQQWWDGQLRPANSPQSAQTVAGERDFEFHCGACHSARGTAAGGTVAPDLTHLMSRGTLAGGMLANNIGNLAGWLANPQSLKPGTNMPNLYLSGQEIASVTAYLQTLQ